MFKTLSAVAALVVASVLVVPTVSLAGVPHSAAVATV
jgi:hypothetical protein